MLQRLAALLGLASQIAPWRHTCLTQRRGSKCDSSFLILFFVLAAVWVFGFLAFHVASGLIHILLVLAVISLLVHLFTGRSTA